MKFKTIATGSSGNCYLLETKEGDLLIEAGLPINQIKKALKYDFTNILACLITHEHGDHAKSIKEIAELGIDVYSSQGTFEATKSKGHRFIPMEIKKTYSIGKFRLVAFETEHDAEEPIGFLIEYKNQRLLFATDTYYLRYRFNNLTMLAIECNYVETVIKDKLEKESIHISQVSRVMKSHFSLENLLEFLKVNDLSRVEEIHLIHLSDSNSDVNIIREEVRQIYKGKLVIPGGD